MRPTVETGPDQERFVESPIHPSPGAGTAGRSLKAYASRARDDHVYVSIPRKCCLLPSQIVQKSFQVSLVPNNRRQPIPNFIVVECSYEWL